MVLYDTFSVRLTVEEKKEVKEQIEKIATRLKVTKGEAFIKVVKDYSENPNIIQFNTKILKTELIDMKQEIEDYLLRIEKVKTQ